jgi:F0F1-type ATP synthase membrane subunit b/b'
MLCELVARVRDVQQKLERAHTQHATLTATLNRQATQYEQRVHEPRTERQATLEQAQALLVENGRLTGELAALRSSTPTTAMQ